jgi:hypothetical protein
VVQRADLRLRRDRAGAKVPADRPRPATGQRQPSALTAIGLQPSAGNHGVATLLAGVQAKLLVGASTDPAEREADEIAAGVMRRLDLPGGPTVRRSLTIGRQPASVGPDGGAVADTSARAIAAARGGGAPLPDDARPPMESAFGASFAGVRIHTDARAAGLSREFGARAFTIGTDIFFGDGQFRPGSVSGRRLLAHELAHTVQQRAPSLLDRAPVRRNLDDAKAMASSLSTTIATKDDVVAYVQNDTNPVASRKSLLAAYNLNLPDADQLKITVNEASTATSGPLVVKNKHHNPEKTAEELFVIILSAKDLAVALLKAFDSKTLWAFAQTGMVERKLAQQFCMVYLPKYEDRFQFNLATQGELLVTDPDVKYGGKEYAGKEHATSGYKWYTAALTGTGPVVLGALEDYEPMRDYTSYKRNEAEAKSVEGSANYLMAWPWSLLVNAALVTGAIHGHRTVIGATDPNKAAALFKNPHGMSVYARELIQLVLIHGYDVGPGTSLAYPEPATGGGLVLEPPAKGRKEPATIFDVKEKLKTKPGYETDPASMELKTDLAKQAGAYKPMTFDPGKKVADPGAEQKAAKLDYEKLKNKLRRFHIKGVPKATAPPEIKEMITIIYPKPPKSVPSMDRWMIEKFSATINDLQAKGLI